MNPALAYLWYALLKRRSLQFCLNLRRPGTLTGFLALALLAGVLFHYRHEEVYAQAVRRESLIGAMLFMLGASVFKGFLQAGMVFEPADVDFLFTGAFTQRQIIGYRLLPQYLFAVLQGGFFLCIFKSHLSHPLLTTACFILFQIACFHVATTAAIFSGGLAEYVRRRICWMLLAVYFIVTVVYLRTAWDIRLTPDFMAALPQQVLFYPAVTLADGGKIPFLREWMRPLFETSSFTARNFLHSTLWLSGFAAGAAISLWLLLKSRANIFEASFAATGRVADRRSRIQRGRSMANIGEAELRSFGLPKLALFQGAGAILWKNFVIARRSKRELALASAFTAIFTLFLAGLRWAMRKALSEGGSLPAQELENFDMGLAGFIAVLPFLLQRALPFDFRRDGEHLLNFRTLPVSPFRLVLTEVGVPTVFCLVFQAAAMLVLMICAPFNWMMPLLLVSAFPVATVALNGVWNLHYLLAATKRAGGRAHSSSAMGTLMIVALSFFIFYPAGWAAVEVGQHVSRERMNELACATWLAVQAAVDLLLLALLSKLFEHFQVRRDAQ